MEARPNGMDPFAATHKAANVHQAVDGAAERLAFLRTRFGRLDDRRGGQTAFLGQRLMWRLRFHGRSPA